jgi:uncharacterized membrane protein
MKIAANPILIGITLGSIPGIYTFLSALDSKGSLFGAIALWIFLCACFVAFTLIFHKQPAHKTQNGYKYAKKTFLAITSLSILLMWWILYNASGAGGFTIAAVLNLVFLFLTISLSASVPLFLVGYLLAPHKEADRKTNSGSDLPRSN